METMTLGKASWERVLELCIFDVCSLEMVGKDRGQEREVCAEATSVIFTVDKAWFIWGTKKKKVYFWNEYMSIDDDMQVP